jgi:tetratricopeptide (TPR) repeat protein
VIRTAAELMAQGRSLGEAVRILLKARDAAPSGRHRIVLTPAGGAALKWDDGLTTLEGQGLLPLDMDDGGVDELFEAAELAEVRGDRDVAARLYDMCARFDRSDAIALYNLGNIRLAEKALEAAVFAYTRALARDANFAEARYNLAIALEGLGKQNQATEELSRVLKIEPEYPDAVFNLAQLPDEEGRHQGSQVTVRALPLARPARRLGRHSAQGHHLLHRDGALRRPFRGGHWLRFFVPVPMGCL